MIRALVRRPRTPRPPPPGAPAVEVRGLTVERAARTVLAGVDLTLRAGEVLALVGPNGAGKSTLLGAVAGDVARAGGRVTVDGAPLASWTHAELAMRRAILPQRHTLAFPFTVAQVVAMGRAPWAGTPLADDDEAAIAEAMDRMDTAGFARRPYPQLSGGEQARVALARVLAQRTGVLLLDEPTAALDLHHQEMVFEVVRRRAAPAPPWWRSSTTSASPPRTPTRWPCSTRAASRPADRPARCSRRPCSPRCTGTTSR
ncbi:ATP-binding cassette domain-containing protein [Actinomadura madurae]|uniref:ATP-binding cassette domain-containing protein n=1 Tax=Actinomadura madurae TaxID=1993 RepID=UPI0020D234C7|nr:ATP-binding cassette domain-containing protein [Actinomadura madurae]MCQ0016596.1 ATP-binding cassette domain-containing protein [Actinomadura madurae]